MKTWIISLFLLAGYTFLQAQELHPVEGERKESMLQQIGRTAASLKTMQCDFEQTKYLSLLNDKMVSKGRMYYKQEYLLRWEYDMPYRYIFILNDAKVILKSARQKEVIDVKSSRLFQEIVRIMMSSVTGKCLTEDKDFQVTLYIKGQEWIARLVPRKKEMKQMFRTITLHFCPERSMVSEIEMSEQSGDLTRIVLTNVQANILIDEKVFTLD